MNIGSEPLQGWNTTPLTSGGSIVFNWGGAGGHNFADGMHYPKLYFYTVASHTFNVIVDVSLGGGTIWDNLFTFGVLAATVMTPYLLPAPMNQTGEVIVGAPMVRITLTDTATANHTYTRFYARLRR